MPKIPRIGNKDVRITFELLIEDVYNAPVGGDSLAVQWSRGDKISGETDFYFPDREGTIKFNHLLKFTSTLQPKNEKNYHRKILELKVVSSTDKRHPLTTVRYNLAQHVTMLSLVNKAPSFPPRKLVTRSETSDLTLTFEMEGYTLGGKSAKGNKGAAHESVRPPSPTPSDAASEAYTDVASDLSSRCSTPDPSGEYGMDPVVAAAMREQSNAAAVGYGWDVVGAGGGVSLGGGADTSRSEGGYDMYSTNPTPRDDARAAPENVPPLKLHNPLRAAAAAATTAPAPAAASTAQQDANREMHARRAAAGMKVPETYQSFSQQLQPTKLQMGSGASNSGPSHATKPVAQPSRPAKQHSDPMDSPKGSGGGFVGGVERPVEATISRPKVVQASRPAPAAEAMPPEPVRRSPPPPAGPAAPSNAYESFKDRLRSGYDGAPTAAEPAPTRSVPSVPVVRHHYANRDAAAKTSYSPRNPEQLTNRSFGYDDEPGANGDAPNETLSAIRNLRGAIRNEGFDVEFEDGELASNVSSVRSVRSTDPTTAHVLAQARAAAAGMGSTPHQEVADEGMEASTQRSEPPTGTKTRAAPPPRISGSSRGAAASDETSFQPREYSTRQPAAESATVGRPTKLQSSNAPKLPSQSVLSSSTRGGAPSMSRNADQDTTRSADDQALRAEQTQHSKVVESLGRELREKQETIFAQRRELSDLAHELELAEARAAELEEERDAAVAASAAAKGQQEDAERRAVQARATASMATPPRRLAQADHSTVIEVDEFLSVTLWVDEVCKPTAKFVPNGSLPRATVLIMLALNRWSGIVLARFVHDLVITLRSAFHRTSMPFYWASVCLGVIRCVTHATPDVEALADLPEWCDRLDTFTRCSGFAEDIDVLTTMLLHSDGVALHSFLVQFMAAELRKLCITGIHPVAEGVEHHAVHALMAPSSIHKTLLVAGLNKLAKDLVTFRLPPAFQMLVLASAFNKFTTTVMNAMQRKPVLQCGQDALDLKLGLSGMELWMEEHDCYVECSPELAPLRQACDVAMLPKRLLMDTATRREVAGQISDRHLLGLLKNFDATEDTIPSGLIDMLRQRVSAGALPQDDTIQYALLNSTAFTDKYLLASMEGFEHWDRVPMSALDVGHLEKTAQFAPTLAFIYS